MAWSVTSKVFDCSIERFIIGKFIYREIVQLLLPIGYKCVHRDSNITTFVALGRIIRKQMSVFVFLIKEFFFSSRVFSRRIFLCTHRLDVGFRDYVFNSLNGTF